MSKRNFPDFIEAYFDYARDGFCPDPFHLWTGISILSGALERKVWIPRDKGRRSFANLFILLVSYPGRGKSSAMDIGVNGLLRSLKFRDQYVHIMSNQTTEAAFYDQMEKGTKMFPYGGMEHPHSSGYLYLSEASNSLKELTGGGEFLSSLTEFFDCPAHWSKTTKAYSQSVENAYCSFLAGCTFEHLQMMIPQKSLMGGFASRLLYVIQEKPEVRNPTWKTVQPDPNVKARLFADLTDIHSMVGPLHASDDYISAYLDWFPKNDAAMSLIESPKMQAILARKATQIEKLSMICCVSESSDMMLKLRHWERALGLYEELEQSFGRVISSAYDKKDGLSVPKMVIQFIASSGGKAKQQDVIQYLVREGADVSRLDVTFGQLVKGKMIDASVVGGRTSYELLVNAKDHL